ncbi:MAG: glycosyltransferase family 2 protein [Bacilli bacterium]|nr:glycosyltransferase family 2 protein [Bacilli bacterium]
MKIGFIVVNYNDALTTKKLIENIAPYKCIDLILIVDNHSTDHSYTELQKVENKHIKVLQADANKGYGSAINFGAKYLKEQGIEWSFISNADIVIEKETVLEKLIQDIHEDRAWIGPTIKEHQGLNRGFKVESPADSLLLSLPFFYRKFLKRIKYDDTYYTKEILPVEALSGCFFLLSLKVLEEVGYFDEKVFLYYEESILARKIEKINKQIVLDTSVSVFHNHAVTINKNLTRIKKYKTLKKSQRYFQKQYNHANGFILGIHKTIEVVTVLGLKIRYIFKK